MNNDRRKALQEAIAKLADVKDILSEIEGIVETAKSEEQEYKDNMPEGLQQGEKGEKADAAIDALESAYSNLETIASELDEFEGYIETATE